MKTLRAAAAALVLLALPLSAQTSVSGEWTAVVAAPRGSLEYTMFLEQEGPRVKGYLQSPFGEIPLRGTVNGTTITLSWTMPDAKAPIDVSMTGTVKENVITGEAALGTLGKGSFNAERTAS